MLVGILIIIYATVAEWIIGLFPDYHIPTEIYDTFHFVMLTITPWASVLPIRQALSILAAVLVMELMIFVTRLVVGFLALIRGSGKPDL